MDGLFHFANAVKRDPAVEDWMDKHQGDLGDIAQYWFQIMRDCATDVRELLHDGHPTACATDAAFAYVDVFTAHVNVGFYRGAEIADPDRLLIGNGKYMRHVKLQPGKNVDTQALKNLIEAAYKDMQRRLKADAN